MDTKQTQNTPNNLGARLAVLALVLVIGFAMGWFNGHGGTAGTSGVVSQQAASQGTTDGSRTDATGKDEQSNKRERTDTGGSSQDQKPQSNGTATDAGTSTVAPERGPTVTEDGTYTSKDEVAAYIHQFKHLPSNFIGKKKAQDRGWVPSEGNLQEVLPGMSIGGSRFYNDDGQLPDKKGRQWTECDINYHGGHRGAERIVFSNDGLIFYTGDHYKTFEQLY